MNLHQGIIIAVLWVALWGLLFTSMAHDVSLDNIRQDNDPRDLRVGCVVVWTLALLWVFGGAVGMFLFGATH